MTRRRPIRTSWIIGGWIIALFASAIPAISTVSDRIERNPLQKFVDPLTGEWLTPVYWTFFQQWLPIAAPVSLLAFACMFLNRPR